MTQIRIKEYLKHEKYYFIPTKEKSEFLAISYNKYQDYFVLQHFKENKSIIGELEPDIYKRFVLNQEEMRIFLKTLVLIWKTQNQNRFNITNDILQKIDMELANVPFAVDKRSLYISLQAKDTTYKTSFEAVLDKIQCRKLYSVIRHIKQENNLK